MLRPRGIAEVGPTVSKRVGGHWGLDGPWTSTTSLVEQLGSATINGDGTETVTVRLKLPVSSSAQKFMRLVVSQTAP